MATRSPLRAHWIDDWNPEDEGFWTRTGAKIANRNLWFSILSEHIGFSIWTMLSVLVLFMGPEYQIDAAGKFLLVSVPTLVGAVLRLPYTFAVARFGGRNWTIVSAAASPASAANSPTSHDRRSWWPAVSPPTPRSAARWKHFARGTASLSWRHRWHCAPTTPQ